MSAKLLYSLSNNNSNLDKQIGCMNGFRQFFDRHHYITSRSANYSNSRILPPDENTHQVGGANGASKKTKGKHRKVVKTQENSSESSRISISSSSASTTMTSPDCERSLKNEQSSPCQSNVSHKFHNKHNVRNLTSSCPPIKTAPREQAVRHAKTYVDSPRLSQPPKPDSPRLVARNESFRSTCSNQSAAKLPLRNKKPDEEVMDTPRFSYDGRETRDTDISSLKLRDLPRLSLDSRQRTIKESVLGSKDDLVLRYLRRETQNPRNVQSLPEEPASYRSTSNIVAKLMGLEALPDCGPSIKIPIEQDDSTICGSSDLLSRSSRTIDESKVNGVLCSPRNNCRESKTPRAKKDKLVVKSKPYAMVSVEPAPQKKQEEQRASGQVAPKHQEVNHEPHQHTLSVYAKIKEKMDDLDFKRSGKDLRALKQILESIHREKTTYISHKQGLREAASQHQDCNGHIPLTEKESKPTKDDQSRDTKQGKLVRDSKKEAAFSMRDLPPKSVHQTRIGKPANRTKATQKKSTKYTSPTANHFRDPSHQTHCTTRNNSGDRTPRPKAGSKGQPITNVNVPSPVKTSKTTTSNIYSHIPAATLGSKTKQHKPDTKGLRSQTEKLRRKSYIMTDIEDHSKVISTDSAFLNQEKSTNTSFSKNISELVSQMHTVLASSEQPSMHYDTWQLATNNKNTEGIPGDTSPKELAIAVVEQPSPVSVLDTNFYGDESPSPVKKKPTAFRDYETGATYMVADWRDDDLISSPNSLKSSFSYEKDVQVDNYSQTVQTLKQLDNNPGSTNSVESQKEVNLEKAYVSEILAASGFLEDIRFNVITLQVGQSHEAIDPNVFHILEQTKGSRYSFENRSTSKADTIRSANERHRRKLLFDTVNVILSQKLSSTGLGSQLRFSKWILAPTTDSREVLQEIFKEINQLQANSLHQSSDDEDDFLTAIIEKDLAHATGNWTDVSSEIPGLVLDIERLIFKDLIVELVNEEASKRQAKKKTH